MVLTTKFKKRLTWWAVFIGGLFPLIILVVDVLAQQLGADPAKVIVKELGFWAAVLLWLSLAASTLRRRIGFSKLMQFRRMLGLYAFFYVVLHFLSYATFIVGWRVDVLLQEMVKRPYIVVGAIAVILLIPLAVTSTKKMQKRLGRRWLTLHKLVYVVGILGLLHIVWMIRASYVDAVFFGVTLLIMYIDRIAFSYSKAKEKKI